MKIIVTGGSGLVGSALQKMVGNEHVWFFPTRAELDLLDTAATIDFFDSIKPDIVVHLASRVGGLYDNMSSNDSYFLDNTLINTNVLMACKKTSPTRLVNILSTCIFPENTGLPLSSENILDGPPHNSNYGYAYSKRNLYIGSKALSERGGTSVVNLIPTNVYGTNDNFDIHSGHVIGGLISKCILAKNTGTALHVLGDGSAERQFVFADDLAKVIMYFVTTDLYSRFENITVCPSESASVSIKKLVEIITKTFEFDGCTVYHSEITGGQMKKTGNTLELERYLPFFSFTRLQDGLELVKKSLERVV